MPKDEVDLPGEALKAAFARATVSIPEEDEKAFLPYFKRTLELMDRLRERIAQVELTSRDEPDLKEGSSASPSDKAT